MPDRVVAAVSIASLAPYEAPDLDWFDGMGPTSSASLRAAAAGRSSKDIHEAESADAPIDFDASDWSALQGEWSWFGRVAAAGTVSGLSGLSGLIDDDLAYVSPWGVDLADITAPVLLLHGANDRVVPATHSRWLQGAIRGSELRIISDASHISVALDAADALRWLAAH
jgi:pimeloyl-ACP methyl ester carboxylesterase